MSSDKQAAKETILETDSLAVTSSKSKDRGLGVFAKHSFRAGELLFEVRGPIMARGTKYSLSVGFGQHIEPKTEDGKDDFGHYMNHSCDPNAFVKVVASSKTPYIEIRARRNIKKGEELTFDYASSEYEVTINGVSCRCDTKLCRGKIHGFKDLPKDIFDQYKKEGIIPDHLTSISSNN